MEDEMERLRVMLEKQTVWGSSADTEPFLMAGHASVASCPFSSDPDDDEEILSFEHRVGGRLEKTIGHGEVHEAFDFPKYGLEFAEEAPEGEVFCSLKALQKYPHDYISAATRERVAKRFFDKGLFFERPWDFFYIHAPYSPSADSRKSILLIPSRQFQHFLISINQILNTHLKLPDHTISPPLLFEFPRDGTPRPRYLGHTNEREMAEFLKKAIPSSSYRPDDEAEAECEPTEKSLGAFKKKIELLLESDKKKKNATKAKKKSERFAKQRAWNHETKRVQRYLGLREAIGGGTRAYETTESYLKEPSSASAERVLFPKRGKIANYEDLEWTRSGIAEEIAPGEPSGPKVIDVKKQAPYTQEDSVVFICVDVEAYERDHNLITEVGIATLDSVDITTLSPGKGGINWMKAIRARHFRITEYKHLRNHEFIDGCAENFLFGKSEWISIRDAPHEISKCFKPPYSKQTVDLTFGTANTLSNKALDTKRSIILVGHDIMTDVNYLKKIGYDPFNLSNLQELIDTSSMYRALKRESNPRNLGSILVTLGIAGWHLHNAGNDAVYTLQAMVGIAITALLEGPDGESREKQNEMRVAESLQNAVEAAIEAQQGWSSEGSDGGLPLAPPGRPQSKRREQIHSPDMPWGSENVRSDSSK